MAINEAIDKFVLYKTEVENQLGQKIKDVRSDRGGEYVSSFSDLCAKHGIRHEFIAPYSTQQKGIAERKTHTLKEMVNAMLISFGLSQDMWGESILTVAYLLNKIPHKEKEEIPYELYDNDLHDERQDQLEEEEVEPRISKRARTEKSFGPDFVSFIVENEPTFYQEAVTSSERHQWKEAIKSEIDSILQNHTWEFVDLPPGCKPLGYKWIFKKKMKADGTIDKYKTRLIIKRYRQHEGLDYFDTYSPVTNNKTIKSIKDMLKSKFDMKDMGLADVILGIKIIPTHNGLVLIQAHYMDTILNTHNVRDSSLARTPIDTSTLPDLLYAVSRLSRYTSNPSDAHWKAMTRVLHYLRYSHDSGLHYDRYPAVIEGYSNANWISDIKDSRSTSGYMFTLGGAAIS
ncbi:retrotransposon protein, putative, ty1-copia subclass [Tanacetum coccineum]